jgi:hypothetical protein
MSSVDGCASFFYSGSLNLLSLFLSLLLLLSLLLSCSLSVNAEPFGSPPQPVALDLLHVPKGLTQLELRNVDITTSPAALIAAAASSAAGVANAAGSSSAPAAAAASVQAKQQQEPAVGVLPLPRAQGGADSVLGQLACLKLESCRLRTRQLEVG